MTKASPTPDCPGCAAAPHAEKRGGRWFYFCPNVCSDMMTRGYVVRGDAKRAWKVVVAKAAEDEDRARDFDVEGKG